MHYGMPKDHGGEQPAVVGELHLLPPRAAALLPALKPPPKVRRREAAQDPGLPPALPPRLAAALLPGARCGLLREPPGHPHVGRAPRRGGGQRGAQGGAEGGAEGRQCRGAHKLPTEPTGLSPD